MAAGIAASSASCGNGTKTETETEQTGAIEIALTNAPADAACLRVTVQGARTQTKLIDLMPGQDTSVFSFSKLALGIATVSADAFATACGLLGPGAEPIFVSEAPVPVRIDAREVVKVLIKLIRNGRLSVGVDFEDAVTSYFVPRESGVYFKDILTGGQSVNNKADGSPYRLVGIPDGTGAFDNGDGTFTWLVNHELPADRGGVREHGAKGAFVSKWTVRKSDLTVLKGEDLIKEYYLWDPVTSAFKPPVKGIATGRFCSADLPAVTAFWNPATGNGYNGRFFMNGEEIGREGRGFAHDVNGSSWEVPRIGKFSWENSVAHPNTGDTTIVAGFDDEGAGQVYVYVGTKTSAGNPLDKAGLNNGKLYGLKVEGMPNEDPAIGGRAPPANARFSLVDFGDVSNWTGAKLDADSKAAQVTGFARPEDGHWNPTAPSDLYFVTTASMTTNTRLWRVRFDDINNPAAGGTIVVAYDGNRDGAKMFDNITIDDKGRFVYLQEDPGNHVHLAKMWRYDIAADRASVIAEADPSRFAPGAPYFITIDEESTGIIDASSFLGPGWFLSAVQNHAGSPDPELVEGAQLLGMYDPKAL
jgi:hypothetical protein